MTKNPNSPMNPETAKIKITWRSSKTIPKLNSDTKLFTSKLAPEKLNLRNPGEIGRIE
ncbi:126_t:CDS:2 [Ambispora gerdemannii]|uniref:126_t:CDS:1 n=1 Tax=Ambispora gerdemannii TaxID=144530 RepID=A0A9N8YWW2_9GLOM|nr:126_t:CDS:2 [Ambispora gerdemannii]